MQNLKKYFCNTFVVGNHDNKIKILFEIYFQVGHSAKGDSTTLDL